MWQSNEDTTMNVTAESSGPSAVELERRLGAVVWAQTKPSYDLLAVLLAEKAKQKRNGKHAGKVKANRTRRAVVIMCWQRRRQLRNWSKSARARADWLHDQIQAAIAMHDGMWHGLKRPPHWTTIDKVINSLRV